MLYSLIAFGIISLWYIGKAALDYFVFKDHAGAKESLARWLCVSAGFALSVGFSLLANYL